MSNLTEYLSCIRTAYRKRYGRWPNQWRVRPEVWRQVDAEHARTPEFDRPGDTGGITFCGMPFLVDRTAKTESCRFSKSVQYRAPFTRIVVPQFKVALPEHPVVTLCH